MVVNYPVSKKAFKLALDKCWNAAWIISSEQNYNKALELSKTDIYFDLKNLSIELIEDGFYNSATFDLNDMYDEDDSEESENSILFSFGDKLKETYNIKTESIESGFIEDGNIVGSKAREFFSLKNVKNNRINKTSFITVDLSVYSAFEESKIETDKAMLNPRVKYIYEASFSNENKTLKTKCDILEIVDFDKKEVIIHEVKASTRFKHEHFFDIAYQKIVLEDCGYIVKDINIVLLNQYFTLNNSFLEDKTVLENLSPTYEEALADLAKLDNFDFSRFEKEYDVNLEELFRSTNFYEKGQTDDSLLDRFDRLIEFFDSKGGLELYLNNLGSFLSGDKFLETCSKLDNPTKNKGFILSKALCGHVNEKFDSDLPSLYSIIGLFKHKRKKIIKQYNNQYLKELNKVLSDDDKDEATRQTLKFWNKFWENGYDKISDQDKMDDSLFIDGERIDIFESVYNQYNKYPVYMYDFETVRFAIPKYNSVVPHTQVTYQYSLHIINDDNYDYKDESTMEHHFFIAEGTKDPRIGFLKSFLKSMLKYPNGVYVAYYFSFEKTRLREMAAAFPEFRNALMYIFHNTIDLMHFFKLAKNPLLIYQPKFYGSASIKKTQPSLDGSISYKDLRVNNGMLASEIYRAYTEGRIESDLWDNKIRQDMIVYCNRDTLAMVVVLQRVRDIYMAYKNRGN